MHRNIPRCHSTPWSQRCSVPGSSHPSHLLHPLAPVLGSSYSLSLCSIHRHTQTALTQLQGGAQPDALLSHPQAQLTNAEAPAHADSSEAQTGTNPPSWDPFLTDTVMLPPGHAPGTLTHLQAMSCTLFLALVWNWVEILIDAVVLVH